jgi:hypothetical protein
MTRAEEFGATLEELRAQIAEIQATLVAREKLIYKVLNKLGDFAIPEREVNGGDLVEICGELYQELIDSEGVNMDLTPRVIRLDDGSFRSYDQDITDELSDAGVFFGPQHLDKNETLVDLSAFDAESSSERQGG